ncbi:unnamed protein product [Withania somnifera]
MNEKKSKNLYCRPIWADLPEELLLKISKCLKYSFQVGQFRAACTSWRSAVPRPPHKKLLIVPKYTPSKKPHMTTSKYIRRSVFRLELLEVPPSSSSTTSYLIAMQELYGTDGKSQLRLLNPITGSPIPTSASSNLFPIEIDLNKVRISVLHKSSLILLVDTTHDPTAALWKNGKLPLLTDRTRKVVLNELMDRLLRDHNLDRPVYHDVLKYQKKCLVTNPMFLPKRKGFSCNHKSYLLKSSGDADLFLVDQYLEQTNFDEQLAAASDDDTKGPAYHMAVRFRVYKLEEEEQCWKEVTSLNDQVIFFLDDAYFWAYCVSAKNFPGCRGNFIYFTDQFRKAEDGDVHYFWDALKHEKDYSLGDFTWRKRFFGQWHVSPVTLIFSGHP